MQFIIRGGNSLQGSIDLCGAKNAATKMMVASLLTGEACSIENCPDIGDVAITRELCGAIGAKISFKNNVMRLETPEIKTTRVLSLSRRNRLPILALGPLLAREREAEVPVLGGDRIGPRPVDFHLQSLQAMGATIESDGTCYRARAKKGLHGARITLPYPSVGATENIIIAATLARGSTKIENAATEPEIIELVKMLQKMGAIIELGANRTISIEGVQSLRGVTHAILPDRNEAVSFACLAVATSGDVLVKGAVQEHLITFLNELRKVGGDYEVRRDGIRFFRRGKLTGINVETDTHPGFMTDWQQPFAILLTQAKGTSRVHETVYEDRFGYTHDLNLMGANIKVVTRCLGNLACRFKGKGFPHSISIEGPTPLRATSVAVKDLRAGIAHVVAALIGKGESVISGAEEIDRGYERIDARLRALGADVKRVND
jgi:UDP-N-acetylglucosamine 1-carboxyvinyltransferase